MRTMQYSATFLVKAKPGDVFAAIHEYKVRRQPDDFFAWRFLRALINTDFQVLTVHTLGLGAIYDWKFRILGLPVFAFQEKVVEWVEGRTVAYGAISGWEMFFRVDVEPHNGSTRVTELIDFSTGSRLFDRLCRPFFEWGLRKVGQGLVRRGLKVRLEMTHE